MTTLILLSRSAAFTLIALIALQVLKYHPQRLFRRHYSALSLCVLAYLVTPFLFAWPGAGMHWPVPFAVGLVFDALASATPAVFALFTLSVFQERRAPLWLWAVVLCVLGLDLLSFSCEFRICEWQGNTARQYIVWLLLDPLPHALRLGLVVLSIVWTVEGWRDDLVNTRRRFRSVFLGVQAALIIAVVILENFIASSWITPESVLVLTSFLILGVAGLLTGYFLVPASEVLDQLSVVETVPSPPQSHIPEQPAPAPSYPEADRLHQLLAEEHRYRDPSLTIGTLASAMQLPEYRLRSLINQKLQYRNFNALLNQYRVAEAASRLSDPAQRQIPILTIALDAGYRSLSTFNKAFKDIHGVPPSVYRQAAITHS